MAKGAPNLKIYMCAPRGFCAGVDRAIQIVELALKKFGAPVYVRHEIVHNRYVVDDLRQKGAIFVEDLDEIPNGDAPVIFSAHGVAKSVPRQASKRNMFFLDATCPLVSKVHIEAERLYQNGLDIILIGHKGHPEVIGTMGQLPKGAVRLIETADEALTFMPADTSNLGYLTQTTLSIDDTSEIVSILTSRFPNIIGPKRADICYATTNRQAAVKAMAAKCEAMIVVGAPNSSNSKRLVEVAERAGCPKAVLLQRASDIDWNYFTKIKTLGITAGASAPEVLVEEVVEAFSHYYTVSVETVITAEENVSFKLPPELRATAAE